ncbi:putative transposase of the Rover2 hAT-like family [Lachancea mirantina]|uniref:Putative transposase of the Rover2 hAT-like family n=1 Tax=Lachancea mirantina TaxID=1230905 RepID=A0A1G4K479_9SACH|nr:putative transposase of the Rover2 hAT-like family [Lachancea mirantina]
MIAVQESYQIEELSDETSDLEGETLTPEPRVSNPVDAADGSSIPITPTRQLKVTGWMDRSALRRHFDVTEVDGLKIASCVHCKREFKEARSTGNLSKHVKNVHPLAYQNGRKEEEKSRSLSQLGVKCRSLPPPAAITAEWKHSPGDFGILLLLTEKLVPFSFFEGKSWNVISEACSGIKLIKSRPAIIDRLSNYTNHFNTALKKVLSKTDFINIELDIWSGGNGRSYLAVAASFAPNLINDAMLTDVGSSKALLNNHYAPYNTHILGFIDVSDTPHTGENLFKEVRDVMKEYEIDDRVATITCDNATNNICMHSHLVHDHFKKCKSKTFDRLGNFHIFRCGNHILNILFQDVVKNLKANTKFSLALARITRLAHKMKHTSLLRSSLMKASIPLVPAASETRWLYIWKQVTTFLKYRQQYLTWFNNFKKSPQNISAASKIEKCFEQTPEEVHLLQYFVDCCSIFKVLNDTLQEVSFNHLSNAVPFYYTLLEYYDLCGDAHTEAIELPTEGAFDFTFINGTQNPPLDMKKTVLDAVLSTRNKFTTYFQYFTENDLYFVAAFLDPSSKHQCFNTLMAEDEAQFRLSKVEKYLKSYLKKSEPRKVVTSTELAKRSFRGTRHRVSKLPTINRREKHSRNAEASMCNQAVSEWDKYKAEEQHTLDFKEDLIQWWYERRGAYPNLFRLAVALLYTKFSTSGLERAFSISGKVLRKERRSMSSLNFNRLLVLRNRFKGWGLLDQKLTLNFQDSDEDDDYIECYSQSDDDDLEF